MTSLFLFRTKDQHFRSQTRLNGMFMSDSAWREKKKTVPAPSTTVLIDLTITYYWWTTKLNTNVSWNLKENEWCDDWSQEETLAQSVSVSGSAAVEQQLMQQHLVQRQELLNIFKDLTDVLTNLHYSQLLLSIFPSGRWETPASSPTKTLISLIL